MTWAVREARDGRAWTGRVKLFRRDSTWAQNCLCCSKRWKISHGRPEAPARRSRKYVVIPRRSLPAVVLEDQQRRPERGKTSTVDRWFEKGRGQHRATAKLRVVGRG